MKKEAPREPNFREGLPFGTGKDERCLTCKWVRHFRVSITGCDLVVGLLISHPNHAVCDLHEAETYV